MSYEELAATALTVEQVKEHLPCTFVLHDAYGAEFYQDAGEWVTHSPFRLDNTPSFRIYGEHLERWIDFAEGRSGDVLDLIGRIHKDTTHGQRMELAAALLGRVGDWTGPKIGPPKATFDVEAARQYLATLGDRGAAALAAFASTRTDALADADTDWLADEFHIEADDEGLIIPVMNRDRQLVGVKTRAIRPGSITMSAPGSSFADVLYGEHRDDGNSVVVLCEGETDVWSGTDALRSAVEYVCLGLPTGAGSHPRQAPRLAGRSVVLAFDGDPAGRGALARWIPALIAQGCTVYVAPVPEGRDLSTTRDVPGLIETAMRHPVRLPLGRLVAGEGTYRRPTARDVVVVSNFTLVVVTSLTTVEGGAAYEVQANGSRAVWTLTSKDLASAKAFREWCAGHGMMWSGTDADTVELAAMLRLEAYVAPTREAVEVAGLYDGHYVWPGGSVGPRDVQYLRPIDTPVGRVDIRIDEMPERHPGWLVGSLHQLHEPRVTDPILAWLAAAPVRSLLDRFPILNITGASGTGKTTLLTALVQAFSGSNMMSTLTGTTRFAVLAQLQSTNGFPVWFDEYRPGARNTTLQELNQLIRDAYAGQASLKGGSNEGWNVVSEFRTTAPIIVSGEDNFSETSHLERMILVHLPAEGRNPHVLRSLPPEGTASIIARDYLAWLLRNRVDDLVVVPTGPDHWSDRQRWNLGVLELGWRLLNDWLHDGGYDGLGEPDWSLVLSENDDAARMDPVMEAIEWALGESSMAGEVWLEGDTLFVRVETLVREVSRMTGIILPGSSRAISRLLATKYGADSIKRTNAMGARARVMSMPLPESLR